MGLGWVYLFADCKYPLYGATSVRNVSGQGGSLVFVVAQHIPRKQKQGVVLVSCWSTNVALGSNCFVHRHHRL